MRKIREVLRLHFELGLEQRAIVRACSISQISGTIEAIRRAVSRQGKSSQSCGTFS